MENKLVNTGEGGVTSDREDIKETEHVERLLPVVVLLPPKPTYTDLSQAPLNHQTPSKLQDGYQIFLAAQESPASKDRRVRKKPRTQNMRQQNPFHDSSPPNGDLVSPLGQLPVELIEEVARYVPPGVLAALMATCGYFRRLFTAPEAVRMWRRARAQVLLTDPPPGWSEHKFASFLFGWAPCEQCGTLTNKLPLSFSLRAKLCQRPHCRTKFVRSLSQLVRIPDVPEWFFKVLRKLEFQPTNHVRHELLAKRSRHLLFIRDGEFEPMYASYRLDCENATDASIPRNQWIARSAAANASFEYWNSLVEWAAAYEAREKEVTLGNDVLIKNTASDKGWARRDAFNSPTLIYITRAARLHGEIATEAVQRHLPQIEIEIAKLRDSRLRRESGTAQQHARAELVQLHEFLLTSRPGPLPQFHQFRLLPSVQTIAATGMPNKTLSMTDVVAHVDADLNAWADRVRYTLSKLLPVEDESLETISDVHWIHPTMRLDALFMCGRCAAGSDPSGRLQIKKNQRPVWRALTAAAVCRHVCPGLEKTTDKGCIVNSSHVRWDEPASRAARAALAAIPGANPITVTALEVENLGSVFRCNGLDCGLTMPFSRVASHALRHTLTAPAGSEGSFDCVDFPGPRGEPLPYEKAFNKDGVPQPNVRVICRHCRRKEGDPGCVRDHIEAKHLVARGHVGDEDLCLAH